LTRRQIVKYSRPGARWYDGNGKLEGITAVLDRRPESGICSRLSLTKLAAGEHFQAGTRVLADGVDICKVWIGH